MFITHSYLGTTRGPYRCLFFLLLEDYIEAQTQFVQELDLYLERFARNLGDSGALVRPFSGDIDKTRSHVLGKNWNENEREEIEKTPSLLLINEDFDVFDPREHPWVHIHFGQILYKGIQGVYEFGDTLNQIAASVRDPYKDVFDTAHDMKYEIRMSDAASIFEAKPGIFGFSIDLCKGSTIVTKMIRNWASRPG